ncbi:MAG: acyltransferase [Chitinophagaceae bacterium]|nr:acyltransferase [Chitinophagaceae bacterium]
MQYIKPLDSIRAFAVLLVIITHWFPETHKLNIYTGIFNGVDIFFVLSGFLITKILFENREIAENAGTTKGQILKSFYTRRTLRIFPIYYLTILCLYIAGPATGTDIRNSIGYFLSYTSNFYFFSAGHWDGMLSHLWSLSVEEQFYLLWPALMLFIRKEFLLPAILLFIFSGYTAQLLMHDIPLNDILTFACFDGFGFGALIAWAFVYRPKLLPVFYKAGAWLAIIAVIFQVLRVVNEFSPVFLPSRILTSVCTAWLITMILLGLDKKFLPSRILLNNKAFLFLGKISYGIYLYHLILPNITSDTLNSLNSRLPHSIYKYNTYLIIAENFILLIALAFLSWKIIEQPLLKLKKRFKYQDGNTQPKLVSAFAKSE